MNLMTSEAALRLLTTVGPANTATEILFFAISDTALGKVLLARSARGVCAILLGDDAAELEADLAARFPLLWRVARRRFAGTPLLRFKFRPSPI